MDESGPNIEIHPVLRQALNEGAVYALRYELFDGLKSMPDINETSAHRHMRPARSTIGIFAVQKRVRGRRTVQRLKSVAIQMDYKQGTKVEDSMRCVCVCVGGGGGGMGEGGVGSRGVVKPEERKQNMLRNSIIKYKIK